MDSVEGIASGVTVVAAGASSSYHVVPRIENLGQEMLQMASPVIISGSGFKRRGRPRKYKPGESTSKVFSAVPLSSSAPPATGKSHVDEKKPSLARPINSEKKQRNKIGAEKLDDWVDCATGSSFLPHVINVNTGEDISTKIMEFSLCGPRSVCVISGTGTVSNVTIRHPISSADTLTYEGLFEIISFNGSFTPMEMPGSRFGMMSISLSDANGRVIGGLIAGVTIAASPVEIVVVSFLLSNPKELKPKKQKSRPAVTTKTSSGLNDGPAMNIDKRGQNDEQGPSCSTSDNPTNWAATQIAERSRKSSTDINISLQGYSC